MPREMTEEQLAGLVRNALLVAGHEMGEEGDHWPVIKSTIHGIARDLEESKVQKEVDAEMKTHLYEQLAIMEGTLPGCADATRAELAPLLKELRDVYDSYFSVLDERAIGDIRDEEIPAYVKRAEAIIATLGGDK